MAEGQYIFNHHQLPTTNLFSYTNPNYSWATPQWLFSLLAFLVDKSIGINGLIVFRILIVLTLIGFLFFSYRKHQSITAFTVVVIIWILFAFNFRLLMRAHIFSILLFGITYYFVNQPLKKSTFYGLPLLFLLWANLHAGVLFGIVLLGLTTIEKFFTNVLIKRLPVRSSLPQEYIKLSLICLLAALFNPHFTQFITYPIAHLDVNHLIPIAEYQTPAYFGFNKMLFFWISIPLILAALIFIGAKQKRLPKFSLSALAFLLLSLKYTRIIPYFEILAAGIFLQISTPFLQEKWERFHFRWVANIILSFAIVMGPLYSIGGESRLMPKYNFGLGVDPTQLPVHLVRFLNENPAPEPLFNDFFWGGYLIWNYSQHQKIFIDGRIPAYPPRFVRIYQALSWDKQKFEIADSLYNFQTLVIVNPFSFHWMDKSPLDTQKWALVFWNSYEHFVYIKRNSENEAYINANEFKFYNKPYTPDGIRTILHTREDTLNVVREIKRHNHWAPDPIDKYFLKVLTQNE